MRKESVLTLSVVSIISLAAGFGAGRRMDARRWEKGSLPAQEEKREARELELRNRQLVLRVKELEEKLGALPEKKAEGGAGGNGKDSRTLAKTSRRESGPEDFGLQKLLETPLVEMNWARLEEKKKDPFVGKHFLSVRTKPSSNSILMEKELEEEARVNLDEMDSLALAQLIDSYLALREAAEGLERAMGSELSIDRLSSGDFDEPDENGEYPNYDLSEFKDGLSVSTVGNKRMIWASSDYPELARMSLLPDYITIRLLEEVKSFLADRGASFPDRAQPAAK